MKRNIILTAAMALLSSAYLTSAADATVAEKKVINATPTTSPGATATTHGKQVITARMDMFVIKPDQGGIDMPAENSTNGKRTLVVNSIRVQYPKGWALVNVQKVTEGNYLATIDRGANESERYATAPIDMRTPEVKKMLLTDAMKTYGLQSEPENLILSPRLHIVWQGIDSAQLGKSVPLAGPTALRVTATQTGVN